MATKRKTYDLDIFEVLANIVHGRTKFLENLDHKEQKAFQPFVAMKWLRGAQSNQDFHVYATDRYVNRYVFALGRHPQLLYKLMCAANNTGENTRFGFPRGKADDPKPKSRAVVEEYYGYNAQHAREALALLSPDQLTVLAEELGYDSKAIKELLKEHG